MTTIAYRDGIVAADSQTHNGDWKSPTPATKLLRRNGFLYAMCGDVAASQAILAWISSQSGPQPNGDATVIRFCAGEVMVFSAGTQFVEDAHFRAWGSGTPVALGAMHAGCSAKDAVRIASLVDPYTGGPVVWMRVSDPDIATDIDPLDR